MIIGVDTNSFYFAVAGLLPGADFDHLEYWAVGKGAKKKALGNLASERIPKLFMAMNAFLQEYKVEECWVEEYAFVGGSRSTAEVGQCVEAVKDACILNGVPCYTIANNVWKKEVIGNGNASKDLIKDYLVRHNMAAPDLDPPDFYDALGVLISGARRSNQLVG